MNAKSKQSGRKRKRELSKASETQMDEGRAPRPKKEKCPPESLGSGCNMNKHDALYTLSKVGKESSKQTRKSW